ncbi:hypothetical protein ABPG75_007283 [Micractinium tetrahymenae]
MAGGPANLIMHMRADHLMEEDSVEAGPPQLACLRGNAGCAGDTLSCGASGSPRFSCNLSTVDEGESCSSMAALHLLDESLDLLAEEKGRRLSEADIRERALLDRLFACEPGLPGGTCWVAAGGSADAAHEQFAASLAAGMPEGLLYSLTEPHPGLRRHITVDAYAAAERAQRSAPAGDYGDGELSMDREDSCAHSFAASGLSSSAACMLHAHLQMPPSNGKEAGGQAGGLALALPPQPPQPQDQREQVHQRRSQRQKRAVQQMQSHSAVVSPPLKRACPSAGSQPVAPEASDGFVQPEGEEEAQHRPQRRQRVRSEARSRSPAAAAGSAASENHGGGSGRGTAASSGSYSSAAGSSGRGTGGSSGDGSGSGTGGGSSPGPGPGSSSGGDDSEEEDVKRQQGSDEGTAPIGRRRYTSEQLTLAVLEAEGCFDMRNTDAARHLGWKSKTILAKRARELGIVSWPYRTRHSAKEFLAGLQKWTAGSTPAEQAAVLRIARSLLEPYMTATTSAELPPKIEALRQQWYKLRNAEKEMKEEGHSWPDGASSAGISAAARASPLPCLAHASPSCPGEAAEARGAHAAGQPAPYMRVPAHGTGLCR